MNLKTKIFILTLLFAVSVLLFIVPAKVEAVKPSDSTEFTFQAGADFWNTGHLICHCGEGTGCGCVVVDPQIIPPNE